jgi:hypothetical protein
MVWVRNGGLDGVVVLGGSEVRLACFSEDGDRATR